MTVAPSLFKIWNETRNDNKTFKTACREKSTLYSKLTNISAIKKLRDISTRHSPKKAKPILIQF